MLNKEGYYDLYDKSGNKIDLPLFKIRTNIEPDRIIEVELTIPVNLIADEQQMNDLIQKWKNLS
jgi:hypothetical protein